MAAQVKEKTTSDFRIGNAMGRHSKGTFGVRTGNSMAGPSEGPNTSDFRTGNAMGNPRTEHTCGLLRGSDMGSHSKRQNCGSRKGIAKAEPVKGLKCVALGQTML